MMVFSPHRAESGKQRLRIPYSHSEDPQPPFLSLRTHKISVLLLTLLCLQCLQLLQQLRLLGVLLRPRLLLVGSLLNKELGVLLLLFQADEVERLIDGDLLLPLALLLRGSMLF